MKTSGAVAWGRDQPWVIEEVEIDPPGPGEVLVQWAAAGLCHSDEHIRSGDRVPREADPETYPHLGGHEGSGIVVEVGAGVGLKEGDHVCGSFIPACGKCRYCAEGRGFLCNAGKDFSRKGQAADGQIRHRARGQGLQLAGKLGTFAAHAVVSERSLVRIEDGLSLTSASLVSCGVATGWGSAVQRAGTRPGDVVVVVGVGGLGTSAVQGARVAGAAEIIAVDPVKLRRDLALKFGATRSASSLAEAAPIVEQLTWGQGAERVVLTASTVTGDMIKEGLDLTAKGGVCVVTGMGPLGISSVPLDIGNFTLYNKELRGCLFGSFDPRLAAPHLLRLYERGLLDLESMITTYPLDGINQGYQDMLDGKIIRGVVVHSHESRG